MKTIVWLFAISVLILSGCAKEMLTNENADLKRAKVPVPMKADFCFTPDLNLPPVHITGLPWDKPEYYLPGGGWISGNATHMGEVIMSESPLKITSAIIDLSTGIVTWEGEGKVTADNGDYYLINSITYRNPDGSFTGEVWMKDGIGKFEGATGSVTTTGKDNCWTAQGTIEYN